MLWLYELVVFGLILLWTLDRIAWSISTKTTFVKGITQVQSSLVTRISNRVFYIAWPKLAPCLCIWLLFLPLWQVISLAPHTCPYDYPSKKIEVCPAFKLPCWLPCVHKMPLMRHWVSHLSNCRSFATLFFHDWSMIMSGKEDGLRLQWLNMNMWVQLCLGRSVRMMNEMKRGPLWKRLKGDGGEVVQVVQP